MDKITIYPLGSSFNNRLVQCYLDGGNLRFNGYMEPDELKEFSDAMSGHLVDVIVKQVTNHSVSRREQVDAYNDWCKKQQMKRPMRTPILFIGACKMTYGDKEKIYNDTFIDIKSDSEQIELNFDVQQ